MDTVDELIVDELLKVAWFKDRQTIALLVRADFKCEYCRQELILSFTDCTHAEKDHIVPTSQGGAKHDESNLAASCLTCNALKGNYMPAGQSAPPEDFAKSPPYNVAQHLFRK